MGARPSVRVRPVSRPACILAILAALSLAPPTLAQTAAPAPPPAEAPPPDPPYQGRLERFSEVLGALHYLRGLCAPGEGQIWRQEMAALLDAEQPSSGRRDRLVSAFNRGLGAFRETYRSCTPAAQVAADRYRAEGIQLAREIATRFAD
jgi:uncharacterized protein (TIGR02301 family)